MNVLVGEIAGLLFIVAGCYPVLVRAPGFPAPHIANPPRALAVLQYVLMGASVVLGLAVVYLAWSRSATSPWAVLTLVVIALVLRVLDGATSGQPE